MDRQLQGVRYGGAAEVVDYAAFSGGNRLKRFGQSIKRIVREVEEQNTGRNYIFFICKLVLKNSGHNVVFDPS